MKKLATLAACLLLGAFAPLTPEPHRRPPDNTFLTGPEWFLVFSPAEYADYLPRHAPSRFPFFGHIAQFWQGYAAVTRADTVSSPNYDYHLMIMVIGLSTTVEYGLKGLYETTMGRFGETTAGVTDTAPDTAEDRLAARTATDYVAFIKVHPWYEFDFATPLKAVWTATGWWGPHPFRKWERKYMLTSEYFAKAVYGWALGKATRASYAHPIERSYTVIDSLPHTLPPDAELARRDAAVVALLLPRYQAFTAAAETLAQDGVNFREIAGNAGPIMLSVVTGNAFLPADGCNLLYRQPILTRPGLNRFVLTCPVTGLGTALRAFARDGVPVEHIYDY
jgi:hypothetical protein